MGDKSNNRPARQAGRSAETAARIAEEMFGQTRPLSREIIPSLTSELAENSPFAPITTESLTANPAFGAIKGATEQQFQNARENIIANTPRGGVLFDALGDLEGARAGQLSRGFGALAADELGRRERNLDRGTQIFTGGAAQGVGGVSNAGALQSQLAASQMQSESAKAGGTGELIGTIVAAGKLGLFMGIIQGGLFSVIG